MRNFILNLDLREYSTIPLRFVEITSSEASSRVYMYINIFFQRLINFFRILQRILNDINYTNYFKWR